MEETAKKRTKRQASEPKFEDRFDRLKEIVEMLSEGELPLEQLESCFKEGMGLCELCMADLDRVEQSVQTLIKNSQGEFETTDFESDEEE